MLLFFLLCVIMTTPDTIANWQQRSKQIGLQETHNIIHYFESKIVLNVSLKTTWKCALLYMFVRGAVANKLTEASRIFKACLTCLFYENLTVSAYT